MRACFLLIHAFTYKVFTGGTGWEENVWAMVFERPDTQTQTLFYFLAAWLTSLRPIFSTGKSENKANLRRVYSRAQFRIMEKATQKGRGEGCSQSCPEGLEGCDHQWGRVCHSPLPAHPCPLRQRILMCREAAGRSGKSWRCDSEGPEYSATTFNQLWETGAPHLTCLNLGFLDCQMGILTKAQTTYFLLQGLQLSNQKMTSISSEFLLPLRWWWFGFSQLWIFCLNVKSCDLENIYIKLYVYCVIGTYNFLIAHLFMYVY